MARTEPPFFYYLTYILHNLMLVLDHRGRGEAERGARGGIERRGHAASSSGTSTSRDRSRNVPGTASQKIGPPIRTLLRDGCLQAPPASGPGDA